MAASASIADGIYEQLRTDLILGRHAPGDRLSIRSLAEGAGLGEAPVREALKRLASERALDGGMRRSFAVPALDATRAANLFRLRALLEGAATDFAAIPYPSADIDALHALAQDMASAIAKDDINAYMVGNRRFHFTIYRQAANIDLVGMIEQLWVQTGPSLLTAMRRTRPEVAWNRDHERICEDLRSGRYHLMREHLLDDIRWAAELYGADASDTRRPASSDPIGRGQEPVCGSNGGRS